MHAPCLDWSRSWRPGQKAHTVSCHLHVLSCKRSILVFPRAKFSTRVDWDLEASRSFRPTPRERIWSNIVQSYFVRCQDLGIQDLAPVSHKCTVSGKQTRHHVARVAREGILMWIRAKLPVHAPCLDWSRFGRSRPEAHAVSFRLV